VNDLAVVILAGGEGSRIGGDKPLRMLGGERLIDRALRQARGWSAEVAVAVRDAAQLGPLDAEVVSDAADVEGPLGGLIAGLQWANARQRPLVLTIPADMPYLPIDLNDRLAAALVDRSCSIASSGGQLHPVCGLWRSGAVERINEYLASRRRSLRGFAQMIGCAAVEWSAESDDPFFNINDPDDLAEAERRLAR
jgi:molybdopterin-guanine dinucleotide biosynthesis protein A